MADIGYSGGNYTSQGGGSLPAVQVINGAPGGAIVAVNPARLTYLMFVNVPAGNPGYIISLPANANVGDLVFVCNESASAFTPTWNDGQGNNIGAVGGQVNGSIMRGVIMLPQPQGWAWYRIQ